MTFSRPFFSPRLSHPFRGGVDDWLIAGIVASVGAAFAWYVYRLGLTFMFIDQFSHATIARSITDSMTPGASQVGFWPPLLHVLMFPFSTVDFLYTSGLAAACALVPLLALSAVALYRLVRLIADNRFAALAAVAAYAMNPFVLYYAATPMMEMLFVPLVIITAYFLVHWWETESFGSLIGLSAFAALASTARFEGFILLPLLALIVAYRMYRTGSPIIKIEGALTLYSLIAGLGIVFMLVYGVIFADNPFEFLNGAWSAQEQQKDFELPAAGNLINGLVYLWHASIYVMGSVQAILGVVAFALAFALAKGKRMIVLVTGTVLISPYLFDIFALYRGSAVIYIPELPPYGILFNERYAMNWIGFAVVMPPLAAAFIFEAMKRRAVLMPFGMLLASLVIATQLNAIGLHLRENACETCFKQIKTNWLATKPWRREIGPVLNDNYAGGRILMTRAFFNEVAIGSGIPLKHFILEANEPYYEQALNAPWLYAEWVVMFDHQAGNIPNWERTNERVSGRWGGDPAFEYFYEPVHSAGSDRLYRLRRDRVVEYVSAHGIAPTDVPSLAEGARWDPETTAEALMAQLPYETIPLALPPPPEGVQSASL